MKASNYGELLSKVIGKPLISYDEFGSYQGDYIATLDAGETVEIYKGGYGSCSGCDWLQAERDWDTDEISDEKAKEFVREEKPFATIPKETIMRIDVETFEQMLPANTRKDIYDFDPERLLKEIKKGITPPL